MSLFKKKTVEKTADEISPESDLMGWYREIFHTGSRVICNPPPEDTDDDYLVLVGEGAVKALEEKLKKDGYELGGSLKTGGLHDKNDPLDFDSFASYKKGPVNVILTCNDEYFLRFKKATFLAKELNLLKKEDRVTLFEAVVWDKYPEPRDLRNAFQGDALEEPIEAPRVQRIRMPALWINMNEVMNLPVIRVRDVPIRIHDEVQVDIEAGEPDRIAGRAEQGLNQALEAFGNLDPIAQINMAAVEERLMAFGNANVDGNGRIVEMRNN